MASGVLAKVMQMRETLEGALSADIAGQLIFDALAEHQGGRPKSVDELLSFVHGPLARGLASHLGPEDAEPLLAQLVAQIEPDDQEVSYELEIDVTDDDANSVDTAEMKTVAEVPVGVVVFSANPHFGESLVAAMGSQRVEATAAREVAAVRRAVFSLSPVLVIVDATQPPNEPMEGVVDVVRGLPAQTTPVVWGAELPFGAELSEHLRAQTCEHVSVAREEGIEVIIELVASRQNG